MSIASRTFCEYVSPEDLLVVPFFFRLEEEDAGGGGDTGGEVLVGAGAGVGNGYWKIGGRGLKAPVLSAGKSSRTDSSNNCGIMIASQQIMKEQKSQMIAFESRPPKDLI
jgi:hypothetical protein